MLGLIVEVDAAVSCLLEASVPEEKCRSLFLLVLATSGRVPPGRPEGREETEVDFAPELESLDLLSLGSREDALEGLADETAGSGAPAAEACEILVTPGTSWLEEAFLTGGM